MLFISSRATCPAAKLTFDSKIFWAVEENVSLITSHRSRAGSHRRSLTVPPAASPKKNNNLETSAVLEV